VSRWFRFYDDVINDPKVLSLSEPMRWAWVAVLCIASKHDGGLPSLDHVALLLRVPKQKAAATLAGLHTAGLLDKTETGFAPHNWNGRQYKSDVSTDRVKRFRNGKRNASAAVSETPPETDTEADTKARALDAGASNDPRTRLFREGLATLAKLTGKGPDACRSFVGKCLQAAGDDAVTVLGLIEDAERNQVVDPSAWIRSRLKGPDHGKPKSPVIQAADNLIAKLAEFDGPAGSRDDLRGDARQDSPRLLSHG
jgi:hypothetical protein